MMTEKNTVQQWWRYADVRKEVGEHKVFCVIGCGLRLDSAAQRTDQVSSAQSQDVIVVQDSSPLWCKSVGAVKRKDCMRKEAGGRGGAGRRCQDNFTLPPCEQNSCSAR